MEKPGQVILPHFPLNPFLRLGDAGVSVVTSLDTFLKKKKKKSMEWINTSDIKLALTWYYIQVTSLCISAALS